MKWFLCRRISGFLIAALSYVILTSIVVFIVILKFYVHIHECVFGVLALESEPVDPRL